MVPCSCCCNLSCLTLSVFAEGTLIYATMVPCSSCCSLTCLTLNVFAEGTLISAPVLPCSSCCSLPCLTLNVLAEGTLISAPVLPCSSCCSLPCLTLGCLWSGTCGDWDPRRWGKRETVPDTMLSPPEWFCNKMGSSVPWAKSQFFSYFCVRVFFKSFHLGDRLTKTQDCVHKLNF